MPHGYIEYDQYTDEIDVTELVTFWIMVETVVKASGKSDLGDRILKRIEEGQLYVAYESVVVLHEVVQQDVDEFLVILEKVLYMIRNAPRPLGEAFYQPLTRSGLLDFHLKSYLGIPSWLDLSWVVYRVYAMVATANQRHDLFLRSMGILKGGEAV
jgi:hypothetical protein